MSAFCKHPAQHGLVWAEPTLCPGSQYCSPRSASDGEREVLQGFDVGCGTIDYQKPSVVEELPYIQIRGNL